MGAIFQGKEKATNKSGHCLTGNLPICISYPPQRQQRLLALGEQLFKCHIKQTYDRDEGLVAQIM